MHKTLLGLFSLGALVMAQNITVNETSSLIQYSGGVADVSICKIVNGSLLPGQGGCYNIPSGCTASVAMGQTANGTASFSFKVTLDGTSYDADGYRTSGPFTCDTLFSKSGLDATVDHTITLGIKGPSPLSNQTNEGLFTFSLISFV
ncbi:hypothetical protein HWV62_39878 [Athelia sp. TMB]|nr:hypothetical protein HWV62_7487 [Athelia sp. TMB]KAF7980080.1 hypothetical protein HWV62_39878 [Athelia sp. TMB]